MRRFLPWLAVAVLLVPILAAFAWREGGGSAARMVDDEGRRVLVVDGDTLKVGARTVRLAGIDALERAQFCMDAKGTSWSCGQAALASLHASVARGGFHCRAVEEDRYGRTISRCVSGGADVGAMLVADGLAVSTGDYDWQESVAREARRGAWAGTFETPAIWRERNHVMPRTVARPH
ncbi:MAG: thermonuclease family protein [Sphingobium sp.]